MQREINQQWFFPHAPEKIWDYLTKPELLSQWVMENDIKPIPGHNFSFRTKPIPQMNLDGIFHCEVLEVVPNRKLSYTWNCGSGDGSMLLSSIVQWTITPKEQGTELVLKHYGLQTELNEIIYNGMDSGWAGNVKKMLGFLNQD